MRRVFQGEYNFRQLQTIVYRNYLVAGESFIHLNRVQGQESFKFQAYGAESVEDYYSRKFNLNNNIGITFDKRTGEPVYYNFCKRYFHDYIDHSTPIKDRIRRMSITGKLNMVHFFTPETLRENFKRGFPPFSSVVNLVEQLHQFTKAEVEASKLNSFFAVYFKTYDTKATENALKEAYNSDDIADRQITLERNKTKILDRDITDVDTLDSKHPQQNYNEFFIAVLTQIGMGAGIPLEVLMRRFEASYSASRGALNEAELYFRSQRDMLGDRLCTPLFKEWLKDNHMQRLRDLGITADDLMLEWRGLPPAQLDPFKEVRAEVIKIQNGLTSREEAVKRLDDGDVYAIFGRLKREKDEKERLGLEFTEDLEVDDPATQGSSSDKGEPNTGGGDESGDGG